MTRYKHASCHPERLHHAKGLCGPCYARTKGGTHHSAYNRFVAIKHKFGLTKEQYLQLVEKQKGLCAICQRPETATKNGKLKCLAVDHDHVTGQVRGLLCQDCNQGLGHFHDDETLLAEAAAYLALYNRDPNDSDSTGFKD